MKDFLIVSIIVFSIIWFSSYAKHSYQELYQSYSYYLEYLVKHIDADNDIEGTILQIEEDWLKREKILIILQDHASMDKIEENLYECIHYYRFGDKEHLILSKDKVLSSMEDLIKREELLLVDIL